MKTLKASLDHRKLQCISALVDVALQMTLPANAEAMTAEKRAEAAADTLRSIAGIIACNH